MIKTPTYLNKRAKSTSTKTQRGIRRFWREERMGYNPLWHCWCGGSIELNYVQNDMSTEESLDAMNERLRQFHDDHRDCEPKVVEE